MNKPRDIKTLLLLVLMHIEEYIPGWGGLCLMYVIMKEQGMITDKEYDILFFYTLEHRPIPTQICGGFFWPMYDVDARKEFIENLISKL